MLLNAAQKATLARLMWPEGKLSAAVIGKSAQAIAQLAAAQHPDGDGNGGWRAIAQRQPRILMVEESEVGPDHPFSGEKLSPVLAVYAAADFEQAAQTVATIYAYEGAGHSVGLHSKAARTRARTRPARCRSSRVIVDQAHCIATGGSFDNGLPFSLSMGCGTWGNNNFSDNMNYRHYMNVTRVSKPIAERVPSEDDIFGAYFERHGRA